MAQLQVQQQRRRRGGALSPTLSIVILAGGEGRRLGGVDKALLRAPDGRALLSLRADAIAPPTLGFRGSSAELCVVCRPNQVQRCAGLAPRARVLADPDGGGPARALRAVASSLQGTWIWVTGVDQYRLGPKSFARLWAARALGAGAVAARTSDGIQPLGALVLGAALRAIEVDTPSLNGLLTAVGLVTVAWEGDDFSGVDTLEAAAACGLSVPGAPSTGPGD